MQEFKFFQKKVLIKGQYGECIYAGDIFYIINKFDMESTHPGQIIPKHTIMHRYVPVMSRDQFVPDHDRFWYFKTEEGAIFLKNLWESIDRVFYGIDLSHTD